MIFVYSKNFKNSYKKLPDRIKIAFKKRLQIFSEHEFAPLLKNHALTGEYSHWRSININADYRLLYRKEGDTVYVLGEIGTHSQLYK